MQEQIAAAASLLASVDRAACLAGAGVSVESGLATFRDTHTGHWKNIDPIKMATRSGFVANPGMVWRWYMARYSQLRAAQPNPGHLALARLESLVPEFTLITQNVDDLHERGGSHIVLHIHGTICRYRCNSCRNLYVLTHEEQQADLPPLCPRCFDFIRPDVVWFEEHIPAGVLDQAMLAAEKCEVMLVVGTSGAVYPAAEIPRIAKANGATIIEINPEPTPISTMADVILRGPSGSILPQLVTAITASDTQSAPGVQTV